MKALTAALAVFALTLAACGGDGTKTVTETRTVQVDPAGETSTSASAEATGSDDCEALGINNKVKNTGTCKEDGTTYTVVNRDQILKLPGEYWAKLDGIDTADSASAEFGETYSASGTLVLATVTITNKMDRPQTFEGDDSYSGLSIDGKLFTPSFDAMNGPVERSCMWMDPSEIQPEASKTCQVVFDIPSKFISRLERPAAGAGLMFVPFSQAQDYGEAEDVGVVRLYN